MLRLFDTYAALFKSWRVIRYEQEGEAYLLQLSALLQDDSRLELRDYLFADGSRKYAYQWMEADGTLRRRWDNAPHWPNVATAPHHVHLLDQETPASSTVTNLEDLLQFIQSWFTSCPQADTPIRGIGRSGATRSAEAIGVMTGESFESVIFGKGYTDRFLNEPEIHDLMSEALAQAELDGKRVLVIIPDHTRTAPIPRFFRLFHELLGGRVAALDYLVALGTHQPMSEDALNRLVGVTTAERAERYRDVRIFNHRWDLPDTFVTIGTISVAEIEEITGGLMYQEVPVALNKLIFDYDQLIICGPTFPHEVVGFSGGNKYFFPGIAGQEVINFTHWLGALLTSMAIIGTKDTPVRRMIDCAAAFIPVPTLCFALVMGHAAAEPASAGLGSEPDVSTSGDPASAESLAGLYVGSPEEAWRTAADLSAKLHIVYVDKPFKRVLSVMPEMYDDLWTAAKGMYKLEPAIADGGEVIIYAPHITEVSYTHGQIIDQIGYHVRDYFLKQWDRFKDYPWGLLAHSTHLRGIGTFENGVERPRIRVTLATGIPEERCRHINLGYMDPASIDPEEWANREDEGILLVRKAGEMLYRVMSD